MPTDPVEPTHAAPSPESSSEPDMFSFGKQQGQPEARNWKPLAGAAVIVIAGLGLLAHFGGSHPAGPSVPDATLQPSAYAPNLLLTDLHMSQAENFAGSQVTYIDGTLTNHGSQTVTGMTVSATFANDAGEQPQLETLPLLLIRTHEPYIDTQPVSASPLAPGDTREFRLIFDDINGLWNQQIPQVNILYVRLASPHK